MNLTSRNNEISNPVKFVSYCFHCISPDSEGAFVKGLVSRFGVHEFQISGELVYCIPNFVEKKRILNSHHLKNRIVLVDRGKNSLLEKVLKIQETEALGLIIADDGSCDEEFFSCGPRAGSIRDGGFAAFDDLNRWGNVRIPVVMITVKSADLLRKLMGIQNIFIPGTGRHNMTIHVGNEGGDNFDDEDDLHDEF